MDNYGIDWLLDCDPRPAQIEALSRSYKGLIWRNNKNQEAISPTPLPHSGRPAAGWGHFMEMRVGKTPTALNEFLLFKRDFGVKKKFMLSPNKYKHQWELEALKFGIDVPVHVFESSKRKNFVKFMREVGDEGMVVANYEALTYDTNTKLFAEWVDDRTYMGADESVMMKNPNSGFFKEALKLGKQAAVTRPMTGLPTPQAPYDLWSQLRFARKLDGFDFYSFKHTFTKMGGFKNKVPKGMKNEERLHELLVSSCFKARRVDWGTKIDSDYERVELEMRPEQKKAYKEMEQEFITWLENGDYVSAEQVITKRIKMQQISSGFIIDEDGNPQTLVPMKKTPKFADLFDRLENHITGKVIVIAHYTETINRLYEELERFNPSIIYGDIHMRKLGKNAEEEKIKFNEDSKCKVIIGQSQAIKYGHTLMGSETSPCLSMAFFENNYSLDNRAQCEERPQGEGQQAAIHIWDYFSSDIEKDIVTALQTKSSVAQAIMGHYNKSLIP